MFSNGKTDMIFVNSFLHKRISDKNENLPEKCVNFGMFGPKRHQFQHPNTRVLLKFAFSLRKIPTLPKALQMSLNLH